VQYSTPHIGWQIRFLDGMSCKVITAHRVRHPRVDVRGQELLVKPRAERGLVAGENIFVASAPERSDSGVEDHSPDATPRVLGGATQECTRRAMEVLRHTASVIHPVSSRRPRR
jgi:UDP-N-acetyl-D-mannosaminuronate dehydrogenase